LDLTAVKYFCCSLVIDMLNLSRLQTFIISIEREVLKKLNVIALTADKE